VGPTECVSYCRLSPRNFATNDVPFTLMLIDFTDQRSHEHHSYSDLSCFYWQQEGPSLARPLGIVINSCREKNAPFWVLQYILILQEFILTSK
jgi:hypothetical protein